MATNAGEENAIMANPQLADNQPTTATDQSTTMAGEPTLAQWKARCLALESRGNAGVMAEQLKAIDLRATIAAYRRIITQEMPLADAQRLLATVPEPPIEGKVTDFHTAIARIERNVEFFMGEHEELRKNHDDLAQLLADESASHLTTTARYVEAVETLTQREEMLENLQAANERLTDLVVRLEPRTEFQEEQIANLLITVEEKEGEIAELREEQETAAKEHAAALAEQDQRIANLQIRNRDSDIAVQEMRQELRNLHKELGDADSIITRQRSVIKEMEAEKQQRSDKEKGVHARLQELERLATSSHTKETDLLEKVATLEKEVERRKILNEELLQLL
jgi:chromosome segregation ATPase